MYISCLNFSNLVFTSFSSILVIRLSMIGISLDSCKCCNCKAMGNATFLVNVGVGKITMSTSLSSSLLLICCSPFQHRNPKVLLSSPAYFHWQLRYKFFCCHADFSNNLVTINWCNPRSLLHLKFIYWCT